MMRISNNKPDNKIGFKRTIIIKGTLQQKRQLEDIVNQMEDDDVVAFSTTKNDRTATRIFTGQEALNFNTIKNMHLYGESPNLSAFRDNLSELIAKSSSESILLNASAIIQSSEGVAERLYSFIKSIK